VQLLYPYRYIEVPTHSWAFCLYYILQWSCSNGRVESSRVIPNVSIPTHVCTVIELPVVTLVTLVDKPWASNKSLAPADRLNAGNVSRDTLHPTSMYEYITYIRVHQSCSSIQLIHIYALVYLSLHTRVYIPI
jgi:hypothetical protein